MGHTIPPKRSIIYQRLADLMRFTDALREPHRSRMRKLLESAYATISAAVYANALDDEEMIIYSLLVSSSSDLSLENRDRILRCLAILLSA